MKYIIPSNKEIAKLHKKKHALFEKVGVLDEQIRSLENQCNHPPETLFYENFSDTGNWCAQDDSYWANYHCHLCGKMWTADQNLYGVLYQNKVRK